MIYVFYFFAVVLIFLSYKSFRGGINYLNFFKQELAKPKSNYTPFVSIIAPCRGLDAELQENLSALFRQDFPVYEIIFVVDDEKDEAVAVIKSLLNRRDAETQRKKINRDGQDKQDIKSKIQNLKSKIELSMRLGGSNSVSAKLIIAGKSVNESQKVHNLREAVLHIADESKIFVFVDSDARPAENWLRALIAPLHDEKIGAATGYRWFISKKNNFVSAMLAVWNASIASALGANTKSNFCWGGSMAMRRDIFEKLEIREKWRGTLSDDYTVTRVLKKAGLPICFVPQALTASIEDCTFRQLLEFTTRQMKITRVYAPNLWIASFIGSFLFVLVFVWGILILIFGATGEFSFWFALAALLIVSVLSIGKARLRLNAVKLVLKSYRKELDEQFWTQNTLWVLSPALFLYNCFAALISRKIIWRGIKYQLNSPELTSIIREKE
jgi:cellulose synthase/poly-beta-1,6-N-acetylglucosamine synthase-like glycosyltransferase